MAGYRRGRINGQLQQELSEILRNVKDYRVAESFVSVTAVDCAADLRNAKVYFSVLGGKYTPQEVKKGLVSATGFIRCQLAQRLNLRITPELLFAVDTSMEHGMQIADLMQDVERQLAIADRRDAAEAEEAAKAAEAEAQVQAEATAETETEGTEND